MEQTQRIKDRIDEYKIRGRETADVSTKNGESPADNVIRWSASSNPCPEADGTEASLATVIPSVDKCISVDNIRQILALRDAEVTFLDLGMTTDGTILKITLETRSEKNESAKTELIYHDTKRRQDRTLKKLQLTKEQLINGLEKDAFIKKIEEYFQHHNGPVIAYYATTKVNALNKLLQNKQVKVFYDIQMMAKKCQITCHSSKNIETLKQDFDDCIKKYEKLQTFKENPQDCIVKRAYYYTGQPQFNLIRIYCITSLGNIYYDIIYERWGISKKEQNKTGLAIERFNTKDIEQQLFRLYRVTDMKELEEKLKKTNISPSTHA